MTQFNDENWGHKSGHLRLTIKSNDYQCIFIQTIHPIIDTAIYKTI